MEISRILRVLITLIFVVTFIAITVSAYRRNEEIESMTLLSDVTSSLTTRFATRDLIWTDERGTDHPYVLDPMKFDNLNGSRLLAGENYAFRTFLTYLEDNSKRELGPYGGSPPEDRMTCSLSLPMTVYKDGKMLPAKLRVIVWYA